MSPIVSIFLQILGAIAKKPPDFFTNSRCDCQETALVGDIKFVANSWTRTLPVCCMAPSVKDVPVKKLLESFSHHSRDMDSQPISRQRAGRPQCELDGSLSESRTIVLGGRALPCPAPPHVAPLRILNSQIPQNLKSAKYVTPDMENRSIGFEDVLKSH